MKALAPKFACAKIAHMDKELLGKRIADARELAGMTQAELGAAVALDRTAISRLEKGERKLNVTELVSIAQAVELFLHEIDQRSELAARKDRAFVGTAHHHRKGVRARCKTGVF